MNRESGRGIREKVNCEWDSIVSHSLGGGNPESATVGAVCKKTGWMPAYAGTTMHQQTNSEADSGSSFDKLRMTMIWLRMTVNWLRMTVNWLRLVLRQAQDDDDMAQDDDDMAQDDIPVKKKSHMRVSSCGA